MPKYSKYQGIIKRLAWKYSKTTNIKYETLIAEGNFAFVQSTKKYNKAKGNFSTYLWHTVNSRFKDIIRRKMLNKYDGVKVNLEKAASIPTSTCNSEELCIFKNKIDSLSKNAKEIIHIVLSAPADLLKMIPKSTISKLQLTKYLQTKNWKRSEIKSAYDEIRICLE